MVGLAGIEDHAVHMFGFCFSELYLAQAAGPILLYKFLHLSKAVRLVYCENYVLPSHPAGHLLL